MLGSLSNKTFRIPKKYPHNLSLRVQVPNNHILTQNLYQNHYYPNPKYQIIGHMDPLGLIIASSLWSLGPHFLEQHLGFSGKEAAGDEQLTLSELVCSSSTLPAAQTPRVHHTVSIHFWILVRCILTKVLGNM